METNNEKSAQSPDEAKKSMKDKVAKGVATVAGALEGFAQEAKKDDLPQKSKQAIEKAGETTRNVTQATKQEGTKVKDAMTGKSGSSGSSGTGASSGSGASPNTGKSSGSGGSAGRREWSPDTPGMAGGSQGPDQSRQSGPNRPLGQPDTPGLGRPDNPGLGRTAARPDSPGTTRRSEGHARSATAQVERNETETGTKKNAGSATEAGSSDEHTRR